MKLCIVDTESQYKEFAENLQNKDVVLYALPCDTEKHCCDNSLCVLFCYCFYNNTIYSVSIRHEDAPMWNIDSLNFQQGKKYVYNKKDFCHLTSFDSELMIDINLMSFLEDNKTITTEVEFLNFRNFVQRRFYSYKNLNKSIPLMKLIQVSESVIGQCLQIISEYKDVCEKDFFKHYNNTVIDTFRNIENKGIAVDRRCLQNHWEQSHRLVNKNDCVFTQYHIYNPTGRPSNRYGKINFSALNKEDGCRKSFVSRHEEGKILMVDYESFHFRLIAEHIKYKFPDGVAIHEYLGGNKTENFHSLYNGPNNEQKQTEFWKKVNDFAEFIWIIFDEQGFIPSPIFKRPINRKHIPEDRIFKVLNYYIQNMEMETTVGVMSELQNRLQSKSTKLVQYIYDAFVFDLHPDETKLIKPIKTTMECGGKFPCRAYLGNNLHDIKQINI
jgi:hypothetical protein